MARTPVTILDEPDRHRVEAVLPTGELAGFAEYRRRRDGARVFVHTEVDDDYEGQGIGSQLSAGIMRLAREQGFLIVPRCPFVRAYMRRHEETHDLLAPGSRLEPDENGQAE
jgi:predicted GNAT family acetyltransferase